MGEIAQLPRELRAIGLHKSLMRKIAVLGAAEMPQQIVAQRVGADSSASGSGSTAFPADLPIFLPSTVT